MLSFKKITLIFRKYNLAEIMKLLLRKLLTTKFVKSLKVYGGFYQVNQERFAKFEPSGSFFLFARNGKII